VLMKHGAGMFCLAMGVVQRISDAWVLQLTRGFRDLNEVDNINTDYTMCNEAICQYMRLTVCSDQ
jgi:hypothetical protein